MTVITGILDQMTREAELVQNLDSGEVRCLACAQKCLIRPGRRGVCQVRYNRGGKLLAPWGYVAGLQADPVEKKPFYHFLPGATALTFGMLGCNFHCAYCQNWLTSQAGRDPTCDHVMSQIRKISPEQIVEYGKRMGAQVLASSYNEPMITSEWAAAIFTQARQAGMKCVMVSNGYATPQALEYLQPTMSGYKIDLKSMQEKNYRSLGGVLKNVLDSIAAGLP